eukprot:CAMPEP_0119556462 /NCGR_PEP_ID=MMETSP1352-20130426/8409_1 /TAXON_ID=265584 /ORGANISM="Stauroneis constricta, Strain CCMP1120" /LENGTH=338 /DNA_ID=CAMNT_0007603425 /DNA_START=1045 /DNA_END=2061 /DNA_ORIENTATION=+
MTLLHPNNSSNNGNDAAADSVDAVDGIYGAQKFEEQPSAGAEPVKSKPLSSMESFDETTMAATASSSFVSSSSNTTMTPSAASVESTSSSLVTSPSASASTSSPPTTILQSTDTETTNNNNDDNESIHISMNITKQLQQADQCIQTAYTYLWNNHHSTSAKRKQYKKAIRCLQRACTIQTQLLGQTHQQTYWTMNFLAIAYWKLGIHSSSSKYYIQSLHYFHHVRRSIILQDYGVCYEYKYQEHHVIVGIVEPTITLESIQNHVSNLLQQYLGMSSSKYHRTWNIAMECELKALKFANDDKLEQAQKVYRKSELMFESLHRGIEEAVMSRPHVAANSK